MNYVLFVLDRAIWGHDDSVYGGGGGGDVKVCVGPLSTLRTLRLTIKVFMRKQLPVLFSMTCSLVSFQLKYDLIPS